MPRKKTTKPRSRARNATKSTMKRIADVLERLEERETARKREPLWPELRGRGRPNAKRRRSRTSTDGVDMVAYHRAGYGVGGRTWKDPPPPEQLEREPVDYKPDGFREFAIAQQLAAGPFGGFNAFGHLMSLGPEFDFFGRRR